MKVTSDNNPQLNPGTSIDKDSTRSDLDALAGDEMELDGLSERTSFASVLDRVTQSHKEPVAKHAESHSNVPLAPRESRARQKDEPEDAATVTIADRSLVREPVGNTESSADTRSLLPSGDLERIVAACQVQVAAGGRHEVTLDLSHSVLDGLRVKVTADAAGRVTTEFFAANDGIKSLLDSRSAELIASLRSRGVNLVSFKSSVAADASGEGDSRSRREHESKLERIGQKGATLSSNEAESVSTATDQDEIGATYRA